MRVDINDINDTVFVDRSIKFGKNTLYSLFVVPDVFVNTNEDYYSITSNVDNEKPFPRFYQINL